MPTRWFLDHHPIGQAVAAACFAWFLTALGASAVFFFRTVRREMLDFMLGFAVMMTLDVALG